MGNAGMIAGAWSTIRRSWGQSRGTAWHINSNRFSSQDNVYLPLVERRTVKSSSPDLNKPTRNQLRQAQLPTRHVSSKEKSFQKLNKIDTNPNTAKHKIFLVIF
jgi:hypothetical protein